MLDPNDIKQIKQVFDESFPVAIDAAFDKFAVTTLNKSFQEVQDQVGEVRHQVQNLDAKVQNLDAKVQNLDATLHNQYPSKAYLDDKLADVVSEIGKRIMRHDEKEKNFKLFLIEFLQRHSVLNEPEILKLREFTD